jgi:hypothetical protein
MELPPRRALYVSAIIGIVILGGLAGFVLWVEGVPASAIGLHATSLASFLGWTTAVTAGALAGNFLISRGAARLGIRESPLTYHLMPQDREERWEFIGVSASAGFCEEFAYHGFLLAGLVGWLGYVLCLPVIVGAGLWPAVGAHFLVNALLGLGLWKWMIPETVDGGQ